MWSLLGLPVLLDIANTKTKVQRVPVISTPLRTLPVALVALVPSDCPAHGNSQASDKVSGLTGTSLRETCAYCVFVLTGSLGGKTELYLDSGKLFRHPPLM